MAVPVGVEGEEVEDWVESRMQTFATGTEQHKHGRDLRACESDETHCRSKQHSCIQESTS